jgi:hypothetical protein
MKAGPGAYGAYGEGDMMSTQVDLKLDRTA